MYSVSSFGSYRYWSLGELIAKSEAVVFGEIIDLNDDFVFIKPKTIVAGNVVDSVIKLHRFHTWHCGKRKYDYKIGLEELIFVRRSNYILDKHDYLGYGAGGENELVLKGNEFSFLTGFENEIRIDKNELINFIQSVKLKNTTCIDDLTDPYLLEAAAYIKRCQQVDRAVVHPFTFKQQAPEIHLSDTIYRLGESIPSILNDTVFSLLYYTLVVHDQNDSTVIYNFSSERMTYTAINHLRGLNDFSTIEIRDIALLRCDGVVIKSNYHKSCIIRK